MSGCFGRLWPASEQGIAAGDEEKEPAQHPHQPHETPELPNLKQNLPKKCSQKCKNVTVLDKHFTQEF